MSLGCNYLGANVLQWSHLMTIIGNMCPLKWSKMTVIGDNGVGNIYIYDSYTVASYTIVPYNAQK